MLTQTQIQNLRAKFRRYTSANPNALKTIALVGGIPFLEFFRNSTSELSETSLEKIESSQTGLMPADEALLEETLRTLQRLGYTVSSEFDPTIVNINEEYGGLDYMDPESTMKFDISIFCYICRISKEAQKTKNEKNTYLKNSPFETKSRHAWLSAAMLRKSKVLVTHGTPGQEVSHKDFKGGWIFNRSPYRLKESFHLPFHGLNAYPDAQLQTMVHRDFQ